MAEEQDMTFPDLPVGQWWKLRTLFKSNLPKAINLQYIIGTLGISPSTAKNTYRNLGLLGLIDKEGKLTDRANDWRSDDLYPQVCKEIIDQVYPTDLKDIAASANNRPALVGWFTRKTKIGETAAHKNAAIFEVILNGNLQKVKEPKNGKGQDKPKAKAKPKNVTPLPAPTPEPALAGDGAPKGAAVYQLDKPLLPDTPPSPSIHIDIQIHISPDAKPDQIEQIFASIEKHLYQPRQVENA